MSKEVFLVERRQGDGITKIAATRRIKDAFELGCLHGRVADPSLSYKTVSRRLVDLGSIFFYDKVRFESETEAVYSPIGDIIIITRLQLV